MTLWLGDIPGVMRRQGWDVGAACMERWFRAPARVLTGPEKSGQLDVRIYPPAWIDTSLVTIQWAMQFARVRDAVARLRSSWLTQAAVDLLRRHLGRAGVLAPGAPPGFTFGNVRAPLPHVDATCQVNRLAIGGMVDPLDDFYAALGVATLKVAVAGQGHVGQSTVRFAVSHLGFYLRDTYDFIGDQELGYWSADGVTRLPHTVAISAIPIRPTRGGDSWSAGIGSVRLDVPRQYRVTNGSFQDYQDAAKQGGDYTIFSDMLVTTPLPASATVEFPR